MNYQKYIKEYYNPNGEMLDKKTFIKLQKQIIAGNQEAYEKLFTLSCFYAYDVVAEAFERHILHGDFAEALQEACQILCELKANMRYTSRKRTLKEAACCHRFVDYSGFIANIVVEELKNKQKLAEQQNGLVDYQLNDEIYKTLNTPEEIALKNIVWKEFQNFLKKYGAGEKNNKIFWKVVVEGMTRREVAHDSDNLTTAGVGSACRKVVRAIHGNTKGLALLLNIVHGCEEYFSVDEILNLMDMTGNNDFLKLVSSYYYEPSKGQFHFQPPKQSSTAYIQKHLDDITELANIYGNAKISTGSEDTKASNVSNNLKTLAKEKE